MISVRSVAEFSRHQIRIAEIVFRIGEPGTEFGGLLKSLNRLAIFFQGVLRRAQIVQRLRIVRLQPQRLREGIDGVFVFARLVRCGPKIIEAKSVGRIERNHLLQCPNRIFIARCPVVGIGEIVQGVDVVRL